MVLQGDTAFERLEVKIKRLNVYSTQKYDDDLI